MGGEELERRMTLKKLCCKKGEQRNGTVIGISVGLSFLFLKGWRNESMLMGLNLVERKKLMTQARVGISGAMSLRVSGGATWDLITAQFGSLS